MQDRTTTLTLAFTSLQPGWPFMDFKTQVSSVSQFLTLEEELKQHHGCIKNIKIYLDCEKRTQLLYDGFDRIGEKIMSADANKAGSNVKEVSLYYEYDNGYEWPLLSF